MKKLATWILNNNNPAVDLVRRAGSAVVLLGVAIFAAIKGQPFKD